MLTVQGVDVEPGPNGTTNLSLKLLPDSFAQGAYLQYLLAGPPGCDWKAAFRNSVSVLVMRAPDRT